MNPRVMAKNGLSARARPRRALSEEPQEMFVTGRAHRPDYLLILIVIFLLAIGSVTIYAISPGITFSEGLPEHFYSFKQLTAVIIGSVGFLIASFIPTKKWHQFELPLITLAVITAISVRLFGQEVYGAYRWLQVGGISFQAAELVKLALVVWLAGFLSRQKKSGQLESSETYKKIGIAVASIGIVVAGLQSDLGSAAVMLAIVAAMTFISGIHLRKVVYVGLAISLLGAIAILSQEYRRDRIATFLNPTQDCQNEGYQACQALITVGSGGVVGKGLGRSVQAYGYLPEAENDSIFAIVAEKFGFIGASIVVGLFFILFKRTSDIARHAPNEYSGLLVSGVLVWLSVQSIINIGAMLGLLPLKGITLPFVSYGGTSIIFVMIALGIVFQTSRYTSYQSSQSSKITNPQSAISRSPVFRGRK